MERLFTREEAELLLPLLTDLLTRLRDSLSELEQARARVEAIPLAARGNGRAAEVEAVERRVADLMAAANEALARINDLGVEVKDMATGLVDFRSLRDGRVVYLCWRLGEPTIAYWHELDAGFAGRQPLDG